MKKWVIRSKYGYWNQAHRAWAKRCDATVYDEKTYQQCVGTFANESWIRMAKGAKIVRLKRRRVKAPKPNPPQRSQPEPVEAQGAAYVPLEPPDPWQTWTAETGESTSATDWSEVIERAVNRASERRR